MPSSGSIDIFEIGDDVEIKGFGRWLGTTLLGDVVRYFDREFYVTSMMVRLWPVVDPDEQQDFSENQDEYHVIHRRFLRKPIDEQPGQEYNIGDIIDWNNDIIGLSEFCTIRKGMVIGKTFSLEEHLMDPDEQWTYDIKLDGSNDIVQDYNYRMHTHQPWP